MLAQPNPRLLMARHGALDHGPESRSVIHMGKMGNLMGGEIVEHEGWRENKAPGEGQRAGGQQEPQRVV